MKHMDSSRGSRKFFWSISKIKVIMVLSMFFLFHAVPIVHAQENTVDKEAESILGNEAENHTENEENNGDSENTEGSEEGSNEEHKTDSGEENTDDNKTDDGEEIKDAQDGNKKDDENKNEADASAYTDKQGITYQLDFDEGTCYVDGYTQNVVSSVVIPSQVKVKGDTYTVKGFEKQALSKCSKLKKIEVPNSIKDILKGTFSSCKNLTTISIVPDKYSVKKSGKTGIVSIRVNSVLLNETKYAVMNFNKDILKEAAAKKGTNTVELAVFAVSEGDGSKYAVPDRIYLDEDAVKVLSRSDKSLKVKVKDTNNKKYNVQISKDSLKQIKGELKLKLQETKTGSMAGNLKSDMKKAFRKNSISTQNAAAFNMSFGNGTKTGADVVLHVENEKDIKVGSPIYVYRYEKNKRDFSTILYHPVTVNKLGNVKLSLDKGGTYVLSTKQFQYMCRKIANKFITESGKTYYIDGDGQAVCGWRKIGESYYYFDRENGKMATKCTVDGVQLTIGGQAVATNFNVQKIQTMIKARNIVLQVTNPSDTLDQKIEKCFRWIFQFPYKQYRRLNPIYRQAGWEVTFANDIFDTHQGCCVSEASATAFLFHECGCETVYVATDTGHAWVELNGRVYDPLFAEARGFSNYYNRSYVGYGMYAVVKHKI